MNDPASQFFSSFDRAIITGGSSGIGAALLRQLATLNPAIRLCNLSRSPAEIPGLGGRLESIPCDLADSDSAAEALAKVRPWLREHDQGGRLLLVNNSGFGSYGVFPAPSTERTLAMLDVNVRGPVRLTAELGPALREHGGAVVNVASTAAFQPTPYLATYGATKAFLLHWSLALAEEWRGGDVHVLSVCPGPTETAFFRAAGFREAPLEGSGGQTASEVAAITLRALRKGKFLVTCGARNRFLAAAGSKLPKVLGTRLTAALLRKMRLERFQEG